MKNNLLLICLFFSGASFAQQTQWLKRIGNAHGIAQVFAMSIDHNHDIVISGVVNDTTTIGTTTINNMYMEGFVAKYDSMGNALWARQIGGSGNEFSCQSVVDKDGNIYVVGHYQGAQVYFTATDSLQRTAGASYNSFLARYSSAGTFLWARPIRGSGQVRLWSVTTDKEGNAIVGGSFNTNVIIGTSGFTAVSNSIFLAKYTPGGDVIWVKTGGSALPSSNVIRINSLATDTFGFIYATGKSWKAFSFGSASAPGIGGDDLWYGRFDPLGNALFLKNLGGFGNVASTAGILDAGNVILPDNTGSFYLGGSLHVVAPLPLTQEAFIARCDDTGGVTWMSHFGEGPYDAVTGIAFDCLMNPYINGIISGPDTICGMIAPYTPRGYTFVARLDKTTGLATWVKNATSINGSSGDDLCGILPTAPIAIDQQSGSVMIAGEYRVDFSLDTFTVHNISGDTVKADIYMARLYNDAPNPNPTTGVAIPSATEFATLYPNPANNSFRLSFETVAHHRILLLNPLGQVAGQWETDSPAFEVDITHLAPGTYLLGITGPNNRREIRKLTKL